LGRNIIFTNTKPQQTAQANDQQPHIEPQLQPSTISSPIKMHA